MPLNNFLAKIYIYRFLGEFLLILPFFAVMLSDYGLSTLQISIIFVVWSATGFILDVPAGVIADKYSRKLLLFLAHLCQSICFICLIVFPTFWGFLVGFMLWGIRDAFISGTFEALVYDELKSAHQEDAYAKVSGRAGSAYFIATMLASLLGSFAIVFGYNFVLGVSAIVSLMAGLVALSLPSAPKAAESATANYFALIGKGFAALKENPKVLYAVLVVSVTSMLPMGLFEFWTLIAKKTGLPPEGLGIFLAAIAGMQAFGSFIAHKSKNLSQGSLYIIFLTGGVMIIGTSFDINIQSLILVIIANSMFSFIMVLLKAKLQHIISSEVRATISSVSSFITRVGIFFILFVFGFLADAFSYNVALGFFGGLIALIGGIFLLHSLRDRGQQI